MTASVRRSIVRRAAAVPLLLALVVLSAACGQDVDKGPAPTLAGTGTIITTGTSLYGLVLTDGTGRTLYQFDGDHDNKPSCTDACAATWQPYIAQGELQIRPANNNAIEDSQAQLTPVPGSTQQQVSYYGHPLYYYSGDQKPGDVNGAGKTGFGGRFTATATQGGPVYP